MGCSVSACRIFLHATPDHGIRLLPLLFFENWLYTATYMADARTMNLPLVTTGATRMLLGTIGI